ncbi:MAG: DUF3040 domain-containing protein [Pseudonocardia sp.]|nr:DUF3040 domain-containing protein [Pseudonocardia sp.]
MLVDRERELLVEIERGLLVEDPGLARSSGAARRRCPAERGRGTDTVATVAGLALCAVLWMGPSRLTAAEIAGRRSAGEPRTARRSPGARELGSVAARPSVRLIEEVRPMIRPVGTRAGAEAPASRVVSYWCERGHHTERRWFVEAPAPETWACRCGLRAGRDPARPPEPAVWRPFKSPLDHLLERRTEAECEVMLDETLRALRARRRAGGRVRGLRS